MKVSIIPIESSYSEFVADKFETQPYESGGTNTGAALNAVRIEDIPMARNDSIKYVMVFTDGQSGDSVDQPAILLHNVTDNVYAFGIGSNVNEYELESIAFDKRIDHGWQIMNTFDEFETFINNFIHRQNGCKTLKIQPYRNDFFKISFISK